MSESDKQSRSVPEIQQEYTQLAAKAGNIQYQIYVLKKDLEIANSALRDLNIEAAAAYAKQKPSAVYATPSEGEQS